MCYDTTQVTSPENGSNPQQGDPCHPLAAGMHAPLLCATQYGGDVAGTLTARADGSPCAEYGLDQATAFRAIHGISNPTAATIVALSDLFAVDAGKLLEGLEVE